MKKLILIYIFLQMGIAFSHPGTGIIIDKFGNIYFIYTNVGIIRYDTDGILTNIYKTVGGHWMCLDEKGIFSNGKPTNFQRITANGVSPAILFAGGGSPIVMGKDGNFYYCGGENGDFNPGARSIIRETPQNKLSFLSPYLEDTLKKLKDGITGITGDESFLYLACWNSLIKVDMNGVVKVLAHPIIVEDCDEDPADHNETNRGIPLLRGLAVDPQGTIYAAATSCHCLLKITPDGKVKTFLKSERPWSPTGVTIVNGKIYILEYTNANGPAKEGWKPRIREIDKNGNVKILVDLSNDKTILR